MKNALTRLFAGFVFAAACVASANAEYRCDPPQTVNDRLACEAAQKGPTALRNFVERWTSKMSSLYFPDYVDEKTAQDWETKKLATPKESSDKAVNVASNERR